jgi:hypothetical protein
LIRHLIGIGAAIALLAVCMFLPFLPGEYDGLAVTLSAMSQVFGMAGLLLVPLGAIWLAHEYRRRTKQSDTGSSRNWRYLFGLASIAAATLVVVVVSLPAFINVGPSLGLGVIALWAYCAARLVTRLKGLERVEHRTFNASPMYLVVVPIVVAILRSTLVGPAIEYSRNRAIENSARLISDIERYREANGHYPPSLLSVWKDYKPAVKGVEQYHYEPNGDAYNLYFEHPTRQLETREIVMYNKRDEHEMTSHAMDLLLLTPPELAVQRGYYAVLDAARPHWKRFLFD